MSKVYCPRCLQSSGRQIEVSKIEPVPDQSGNRVWKSLCPQCGAQGLVPDVKQRRCPSCGVVYTDPVPYVANAPGV